MSGRLPNSAHTSRPWRIHELTRDFRLEDVWALPTPGGRDDFPLLVEGIAESDPERHSPLVGRALWALRWKLGALLGWDDPNTGVGSRVASLRDRLPADLSDGPSGPEFTELPFTSLYLTGDEWAAEAANQTMHGVVHLGWVADGSGGYRGQMAVLVKPNGRFGRAYMAAIRPFRHLLVYPPAIRVLEREWRSRRWSAAPSTPSGRGSQYVSSREARVARTASAAGTPASVSVPVRPASTNPSPPGVIGSCASNCAVQNASSTSAGRGVAPTAASAASSVP